MNILSIVHDLNEISYKLNLIQPPGVTLEFATELDRDRFANYIRETLNGYTPFPFATNKPVEDFAVRILDIPVRLKVKDHL